MGEEGFEKGGVPSRAPVIKPSLERGRCLESWIASTQSQVRESTGAANCVPSTSKSDVVIEEEQPRTW
jgi:hypothetical protein